MTGVEAFFSSGRAADLVLAFMAVEVVALALLRILRGQGVPLGDLVWINGSGVCLVLGLRAALTGAGWPWIGLALTGSLVCHLMDLRRRWSTASV